MEKFPKFSQEKPPEKGEEGLKQVAAEEPENIGYESTLISSEKLREDEEYIENPEWSLTERERLLAEQLKDRGYEDPEIKAAVNAWMAEEEDKVMKENTVLATIGLNVKLARFYFAAGYNDEAFESYQQVLLLVDNQSVKHGEMAALYKALRNELDKTGL